VGNLAGSADELRSRTKQFALRIVKLFRSHPRSPEAQILGKHVLRSGTSVAANYRAVCRARSKAEFVARIGIVAEEADETQFWLELLVDAEIMPKQRLSGLLLEAGELTAIFSASQRTAKVGSSAKVRSHEKGNFDS
jgi:four helix bundle protein